MEYETSDFPEICWLIYHKIKVVGIEGDKYRRIFRFAEGIGEERRVNFFGGKEVVEPIEFTKAVKSAKGLLKIS